MAMSGDIRLCADCGADITERPGFTVYGVSRCSRCALAMPSILDQQQPSPRILLKEAKKNIGEAFDIMDSDDENLSNWYNLAHEYVDLMLEAVDG